MKNHPGTSGLIPVKGSGCGIRPDPDALENSDGFDFSNAKKLLKEISDKQEENTPLDQTATNSQAIHDQVQTDASD